MLCGRGNYARCAGVNRANCTLQLCDQFNISASLGCKYAGLRHSSHIKYLDAFLGHDDKHDDRDVVNVYVRLGDVNRNFTAANVFENKKVLLWGHLLGGGHAKKHPEAAEKVVSEAIAVLMKKNNTVISKVERDTNSVSKVDSVFKRLASSTTFACEPMSTFSALISYLVS